MLAKCNFSVFRQFFIKAFFEARLSRVFSSVFSRVLSSVFSRSSAMFSSSSLMPAPSHLYCLARGFLFLLAGISLSVLTACAGGGGSSGSSSSDDEAFKVELTFSPTAEGFVIGNQSDFGDFVSLNITAISEDMSMIQERNISTAEFVDDSYDFTGLDEQANWTFAIIGTLSNGEQEKIVIDFVWQANEADHESGGIQPGNNTDGDGRADSVDEDDDNDGIGDADGDDCPTGETGWASNPLTDNDMDGCLDESDEDTDDDNDGLDDSLDQCSVGELDWMSNGSTDYDSDGCLDESDEDTDDDNDKVDDSSDQCHFGELGWMSNGSSDHDGDGCRDKSEDPDDDNDKVDDSSDQCHFGETGWMSNGSSDNDGDGCRDDSIEDTDDDNDGLEDTDPKEEQINSAGVSCSLLADCDRDNVKDIDEATVDCVIKADCDDDDIGDERDACPAGETGWMSNGSSDNDGDGCRDDSIEDTDDDNDGLADTDPKEEQSVGGVSCRLLADCDGDTVRDIDEAAVSCVIELDCDSDGIGDEGDGCPAGEISWTSDPSIDNDEDGCRDDIEDIDDDGDGLIEIGTAEQLDAVRYALNGNGSRSSEMAALNTTGCGDGSDITSCSGYELIANISLAAYRDGKGWQPLGRDTNGSHFGCQGAAFNGTFDGNGLTISDLNISRSDEDCVGLFGHLAADATIRNLTLRAETVDGRGLVGGLVGDGEDARIVSSSIVVGKVSGSSNTVGGLVGDGEDARIVSSSIVVGKVSGSSNTVGGLVGDGEDARIVSSSVVASEVSGGQNVGGLAGAGSSARIVSSSVVVKEVGGISAVGGLVGSGLHVRIYSSLVVVGEMSGTGLNVGGLVGSASSARIYSSSVVVGEFKGSSFNLGGLAATFNSASRVAYSYVVSGSNTRMLVGIGSGAGAASYWDRGTSDVTDGNHGSDWSGSRLRRITSYTDIYADWDDNPVIFDDGSMIDEPLAVWCDKDHSGNITADEENLDNRIWDFGSSSQYPAIRCTPIGPTEWRSWWSLVSGKPQLDQNRLNRVLNQ